VEVRYFKAVIGMVWSGLVWGSNHTTWVQDKVSVYVSKEEKSWHHLQIY